MEDPKEPTTISTTTTQSTTTPGIANTSERILIALLGILFVTILEIPILGMLSGKPSDALAILASLAGNVLSGLLALMVSKRQ